jgi:hypothetical protein
MILMTDIGRMIMVEAIAEGKAVGKAEAKAEFLTKLLIRKFYKIPNEYKVKIKNLPEKVIDIIATDIFDINNINELEKYFK